MAFGGEPIRKRSGGAGTGGSQGGAGGHGAGGQGAAGEIPDKLYFRIGEVARLCDVPAYVLRFWESEFPQLKPNKGGTGQRLYRRRDVEMALRIKALLYDEGYTIAGARQAFKAELRTNRDASPAAPGEGGESAELRQLDTRHLEALQKELREIYTLLSRPAGRSAVQAIRPPRPLPEPRERREPVPFPRLPGMGSPGMGKTKPAPLSESLFGDPDEPEVS